MGARIRGSGHGTVSTEMRVILYPATPVSAGTVRVRPVQATHPPTNPPTNPSQRLHLGLHAVDRLGRSSRMEVASESSVCLRRLLLKCSQLPEQMATRCVWPYLFYLFRVIIIMIIIFLNQLVFSAECTVVQWAAASPRSEKVLGSVRSH